MIANEILDALDYFALQTRTIWQLVDNAIYVAPDNQTVRRDLEPRTVKTIRLTNSPQRGVPEVITALRTILNLTQLEALADAIVIQDTPANIALAEKVISLVDKSAGR